MSLNPDTVLKTTRQVLELEATLARTSGGTESGVLIEARGNLQAG
jgi:hypothetical protein